jgi:hypothetical protein
MLHSRLQLPGLRKASMDQSEDALCAQLLLQLGRSTTSHAAVAAVTALHDARESGTTRVLAQDDRLQQQFIIPLLLALRPEKQCMLASKLLHPTVQVTAAAADLLHTISKSSVGMEQLQQHLPALADTYISTQQELCLEDTQRQAAGWQVMATIHKVLCRAAITQRLQEQHV